VRNPARDIQVVRVFEDGPYVFCHVFQSLNNGAVKGVTADLFETDFEGRIIGHWDVIEAYAESPASGRTMVDGPGKLVDIEHTETNKQLVRDFVANVLVGRQYGTLGDYISAESWERHRPGVAGGIDGFRAHLSDGVEYVKVHHVVGQGNFVTTYSLVCIAGEDLAVFDIFRIDKGRIVEHWDVIENDLATGSMDQQRQILGRST
jgi:predicted SnoaL-like aldol condensation-catalyzing enzyme